MISETFWRGKSVIVTGGSSGIGLEIARAAAAAGGRVGVVASREGPLTEAAAGLAATGACVHAAAADVTDFDALEAAVRRLESATGPCAVAIACAGIHRTSWPLDAATAGRVIDVNVKGCINLAATVLPGMLARRAGHLCGVASIAAVVGLPGNAAYCASKAALVALLESLRLDCGPAGIRVTTASPGFVDTPMVTDEERAAGGLMPADRAAALILGAIERGRAEAWFPRRTWLAARLARALPPMLRDRVLRGQQPMAESPRDA
jgi:NAD(P)-dependent dehydrogenase (short-subunit alcohol dehydrogenase family)